MSKAPTDRSDKSGDALRPLGEKALALLALKLHREGRMPEPGVLADALGAATGTPTERPTKLAEKKPKRTYQGKMKPADAKAYKRYWTARGHSVIVEPAERGLHDVYLTLYPKPEKLSRSDANGYNKVIVSSSQREGSTLAHARAGLSSPEFEDLVLASHRVPGAEGGKSGYGFWSDGAEESRIVNVANPALVPEVAAHLGKAFGQKAAIGFTSGAGGGDIAHVLSVPSTNVQAIADGLGKHGVQYKTVVPKPAEGRSEVHILDENGDFAGPISNFARETKSDHQQHVGKIHFIGGETREDGQQAYDRILRGS